MGNRDMFRFLKNVLGTGTKAFDGIDANSIAPSTDIKNSFSDPLRVRREIQVTRAMSKKATRMKLERILEKTEKRR
jgi:hypothetical protein